MVKTKTIAPVLLSLTATVALTASGALTATATAEPAPAPANSTLQLQGTDHGVGYQVALTDDHRATVSTLQAGRFLATWDGEAIIATDDEGRVLATVPLKYDIAGKSVEFAPAIDTDNKRLTLTPVTQSPTPLRDIDAQQRFFDVVQANMPTVLTGAAIGGAIGFLLGFPAGLFVFDIVTAPIGLVVGSIVGAAIGLQQGGGQEAVNAALTYADTLVPGASQAIRPAFEALPAPQQPN
ncbi:hypothetical protein OHB26_14765 [Nocardia sp. NBC_01503]|uniref:hypothetical protein n=1 Tax=Nocardia sp. NBC_01503 TaxID=2975997 RepID=UPI002E7C2B96|nr:hypothetical protein [Nocardia sp. NBC_01503]WTL35338.1 hypothetical protein OHB26_14765 [Nocardia sp. NBC_01503]